MNTNEKIVASALKASNHLIRGIPSKPGWCLQLVRLIVEDALFDGRVQLYATHLVAGTTRRPGTAIERQKAAKLDPWSSDFEASVKKLGLAVPFMLRKPGDLIFNHNAAKPFGHVGILITRDLVLENIDPNYRPKSIHLTHSMSITPVRNHPWTLVARLKG